MAIKEENNTEELKQREDFKPPTKKEGGLSGLFFLFAPGCFF
jgi:hypothetical protein